MNTVRMPSGAPPATTDLGALATRPERPPRASAPGSVPDLAGQVPDDRERRLAKYFEDHVAAGRSGAAFLGRHPVRALTALADLYSQPHLVADPSDDLQGRAVRQGLDHPSRVGRTVVHSATAMLFLPEQASDYSLGSAKQTLRRKVRKARARGVHWAEVHDPVERRRLVDLADEQERHHPLEEYRRDDPDNAFLLDFPLWLVAYGSDDRPVHLSVTPYDGDWATLMFFRTLGNGPEQSDARYLMTQVLVERLVGLGVRYLADVSSPAHLSNGCREFQRMLGFRIARVSLRTH